MPASHGRVPHVNRAPEPQACIKRIIQIFEQNSTILALDSHGETASTFSV
jgi:hypothetical protein